MLFIVNILFVDCFVTRKMIKKGGKLKLKLKNCGEREQLLNKK